MIVARQQPPRLMGALMAAVAMHAVLAAAVIAMLDAMYLPSRDKDAFEVVELAAAQPQPASVIPVARSAAAAVQPPHSAPSLPQPAPVMPPVLDSVAPLQSPASDAVPTRVEEPTSPAVIASAPVVVSAPVMTSPTPTAVAVADDYVPPDVSAAYRSNPPPSYPFIAKRRGLEGVVVLRVALNANGVPQQVTIERGSGHGVLDEAALESVRGWRFAPAQRGGRAVAAVVDVPVRFSLR